MHLIACHFVSLQEKPLFCNVLRLRSSTLHINVKSGVAVYLNPATQFSVYRVVRTTSPFSDSID